MSDRAEMLSNDSQHRLSSHWRDIPVRASMNDIIGGFPFADPNCKGCRKPLTVENAWMTDGCSCNSSLGINNLNETRWRLLMQLQQQESREIEQLKIELADARFRGTKIIEAQQAEIVRLKKELEISYAGPDADHGPGI